MNLGWSMVVAIPDVRDARTVLATGTSKWSISLLVAAHGD